METIRNSNASSYTFNTNELSNGDKISLNLEYIDSQEYQNTSISESHIYRDFSFNIEGTTRVGQTLRIQETSADSNATRTYPIVGRLF